MSDKLKKIQNAIKKINEQADSPILKLASDTKGYELLDTPFSTVNSMVGGIPRGRFSTIAGPQHTGKGAFCLQLIAHHMNNNPDFFVLWTDAESSLDTEWAEKLGVDLERLIIQRYTKECDTMEKLLDRCLDILKATETIDMWVIDSLGALLPKADIYESKGADRSLENPNMLNLQRKLGEFYRKANIYIAPNESKGYKGCAVICIGQIYTVPEAHVTLEEVRGGNAVKHWAHLRLLFRRGPKKDWPEVVEVAGQDGITRKIHPGWAGRIKLDKTRINANEGQEVLLTFMQGRGFDSKQAALSAAFGLNIIKRAGPTYSCSLLPNGKLKGKAAVVEYFLNNDDKFKELEKLINDKALEELSNTEENQSKEE